MQGGYLEVSQAEQEATSTDKPILNHPKNISEKGYRCVCLNARRGYLEVSQAEQEATSTDKPILNHLKKVIDAYV